MYLIFKEDEVDLPPEVMKRLYELKALQSEKDIVSVTSSIRFYIR